MLKFIVYPAIDVRGGRCVRLFQGDYGMETVYDNDPIAVARRWAEDGAPWLHVVDLDAARTGELLNLSVIQDIVAAVDVPVQVGGGVRDLNRLNALLKAGVSRVVIGSAAIDNPEFVKAALGTYGDQIALGMDVRKGFVATHGWLETSEVSAKELSTQLVKWGAETFVFTDISKDGTLAGPNIPAVRSFAKAIGKNVIASGGVRSMNDLTELAGYEKEGIGGVILGKALYTGAIDLAEALDVLRGGEGGL